MSDSANSGNAIRQDVRRAAEIIRAGGIVAFPTETYYGLAVDAFNVDALARLFKVKRRDADKPVLTLIPAIDQLPRLVKNVPAPFRTLMELFWPGPLTLVFEGHNNLPGLLTGGTGTIGVRISSHPVAQLLVEAVGVPITATSANISGNVPAVNANQVEKQLGSNLDLLIDGGETPGGKGSTIIGWRDEELILIRDGVIPFDRILSVFR